MASQDDLHYRTLDFKVDKPKWNADTRVKTRLIIKICISFFISRDYYKSLSTFAPMQIFPREKLIGFRVFLLITSIIIIQWIKFSSVKRSNEMWMGSIAYPCTRRDHAKTSSDLMLVEYSLFRETGNIRIVNFNNVSIPLGYTPHVRAHVANWSRTPELIMPRCHCTRFA